MPPDCKTERWPVGTQKDVTIVLYGSSGSTPSGEKPEVATVLPQPLQKKKYHQGPPPGARGMGAPLPASELFEKKSLGQNPNVGRSKHRTYGSTKCTQKANRGQRSIDVTY